MINHPTEYPPRERYPKPADFTPILDFPEEDGRRGKFPRCQAWNHYAGRQCLNAASRGKRVCRFHGGKSKGGLSSPVLKHGKYSKYLPGDLKKLYASALSDKNLLSLNDEIAALDSRIKSVMEKIDSGEAGQSWGELRKAYTALDMALKTGNKTDSARQFELIGSLIEVGNTEHSAWSGIRDLFELRRRLVETERKLEIDKQLYLTVETALTWFRAIALAVSRHVTNRAVLAKIQADWDEINRLDAGEK